MPGDMRLRLRDVLAQLSERDSVVPAEPMRLRVPLIMISGFSPVQTSLAVRRQPQHGRSSQQPTRHPPPHKPTRLLRASPLGPKREPSPLGCRRELRRCSGAGPKSPISPPVDHPRIRSLGLLPGDLQPEKSGMRWPWAKEDSRDAGAREPRLGLGT